jgi:sulfate/thiosulfate-binding protein
MSYPQLRRIAGTIVPLGVAILVAAGCGSDDSSSDSSGSSDSAGANDGSRVSLVAFSTPREAYEALIPEFNKTDEGLGVEFDQSYGSSGEQSRAIEGGLPADLTHLALAPDVKRLTDAGLVDADWNSGEYKGMLTNSTVALVVRPGNPKKIEDWDDLTKDGIEVVTANPFTSGGARWNLMAAYGAWTRAGDTHEEALAKLEQLLRNTPVQSKSAREALQVFASGKGDVMISYEQEAIQGEANGEEFEHFVPSSTILIENPVALTNNSENPEAAQAFLDYLYTVEAQDIFASFGYRPVVEGAGKGVAEFPTPEDLFTIEDVGGWDKVMDEFFDREKGYVADINKKLGVPTDG